MGFCTAPRRLSAMDSTTVSMRVGSCQHTTLLAPIPLANRPAAVSSARSAKAPNVTTRSSASISMGCPGEAAARRSTSSHMVRAPVMACALSIRPSCIGAFL